MGTLKTLTRRFAAAADAFRDAPPQHFLIVERVRPLGWCVLHAFGDYADAYAQRAARYANDRQVRVMTEAEWRRRTLALMRTREPWFALARLEARLVTAQSELADERAVQRATFLDAFSEVKHP